jgi:hypothetical protein
MTIYGIIRTLIFYKTFYFKLATNWVLADKIWSGLRETIVGQTLLKGYTLYIL